MLSRTELGNPILRKKAKRVPLAYLTTAEFTQLERDMVRTMRSVKGVGLAAPQIGVSLRIAVLEMYPSTSRPNIDSRGPLTIINPRVIEYGSRMVADYEGCLSFIPFRGRVSRSQTITVEYVSTEGELIRETVSGLWARIFQHEIDHLDGMVYLDRMSTMKDLMTLAEFRSRVLPISRKK